MKSAPEPQHFPADRKALRTFTCWRDNSECKVSILPVYNNTWLPPSFSGASKWSHGFQSVTCVITDSSVWPEAFKNWRLSFTVGFFFYHVPQLGQILSWTPHMSLRFSSSKHDRNAASQRSSLNKTFSSLYFFLFLVFNFLFFFPSFFFLINVFLLQQLLPWVQMYDGVLCGLAFISS